ISMLGRACTSGSIIRKGASSSGARRTTRAIRRCRCGPFDGALERRLSSTHCRASTWHLPSRSAELEPTTPLAPMSLAWMLRDRTSARLLGLEEENLVQFPDEHPKPSQGMEYIQMAKRNPDSDPRSGGRATHACGRSGSIYMHRNRRGCCATTAGSFGC